MVPEWQSRLLVMCLFDMKRHMTSRRVAGGSEAGRSNPPFCTVAAFDIGGCALHAARDAARIKPHRNSRFAWVVAIFLVRFRASMQHVFARIQARI
jgi:hypothetical protein